MRSCLCAAFAVAVTLAFSTGVQAQHAGAHDHAPAGRMRPIGYRGKATAATYHSGCTDCGVSVRGPLLAPHRCTMACGHSSQGQCGNCPSFLGEMLMDVRNGVARIASLLRCTSCGRCHEQGQCGLRTICLPLPRLRDLLPICGLPRANECYSALGDEIISEQMIDESDMAVPQPAIPEPAPEVNDTDPFRDDPSQHNHQTLRKAAPGAKGPTLRPVTARPMPVARSIIKRTVHEQVLAPPAKLVPPRHVSQSTSAAKPLPLPKATRTRPAIRMEPSANRIYLTGSRKSQGHSTIRFR